MLILKTEIDINRSPEYVYNWVIDLDNNKYCNWHPDHKLYYRHNDKVQLEEKVDSQTIKLKGRLVSDIPNKELRYRGHSSIMPIYLSLNFEESTNGTRLINEIGIGFNGPLGVISDFLIRKFYKWDSMREKYTKHLYEEWTNLETIE